MTVEKTLLQVCVALAACVPVSAGAAGILLGVGMIPGATHGPSLDSHYAYLSGLLLAIGLGFWSCVPGIGRKTGRMRLLAAIVVIGGLGRALMLLRQGASGGAMHWALVMELAVTPLLCLWQARIARLRPASPAARRSARPLPDQAPVR